MCDVFNARTAHIFFSDVIFIARNNFVYMLVIWQCHFDGTRDMVNASLSDNERGDVGDANW